MKEQSICPGCGPNPVIHWVERWSVIFTWLTEKIGKPFDLVWRLIRPRSRSFGDTLTIAFMTLISAIGIGSLREAPDEKTGDRAGVVWEEARRRGIRMREFRVFGRPTNMFIANFNGTTLVFEALPKPKGWTIPSSLEWMDDKGIMRERFAKKGFPVPKGGVATTFHGAKKIFSEIGGLAIVKPNIGSRSRHTTLHVTDEAALTQAFRSAAQLSPWVIVEEELAGSVFRITLVNGKVVAALRRDPPEVTGDGVTTVRELIELENKNPKRHGKFFHELPTDQEAELELHRQGFRFDSVPEKGRVVFLDQKIGRGSGGSNEDVTDDVHPKNIELFESIGAFLNYPYIGIDFMIQHIEKPWSEELPCGVIEVNSLPFIDLHHFPMQGQSRNIASLVWDFALPSSRSHAASQT